MIVSMSKVVETVAVYEADDGILLFGSEAALAEVDSRYGASSRAIPGHHLVRAAGQAANAAGALGAQSGRWLKLTQESAADLARHRDKFTGAGVLRRDTGQVFKHLKFEDLSKGALLTPAAPAVLGALATQYALESALDDITAYLEVIDEKLDTLLRQPKIEALAELDGVSGEIEEAYSILAETGRVSTITWSKVQTVSRDLKTMQATALSQLEDLAEGITTATGDTDRTAKRLAAAREDAQFWLGVLARTLALQDRQWLLELGRVADDDPDELEGHRRGITLARRERHDRIAERLEAMTRAVSAAATLSNAAKVANPLNAPRVILRANALDADLTTFAAHAGLDMDGSGEMAPTPWRHAARDLAGDALSAVGDAGSRAADRARAAGRAIEDRRDQRVLRKAEKIEEKRRQR